MNRKKYKRCNLFTDEGKPRRDGCPRSASTCAFAHPTDPEWDGLPTVRSPPPFVTGRPRGGHRSPPSRRDSLNRARRSLTPEDYRTKVARHPGSPVASGWSTEARDPDTRGLKRRRESSDKGDADSVARGGWASTSKTSNTVASLSLVNEPSATSVAPTPVPPATAPPLAPPPPLPVPPAFLSSGEQPASPQGGTTNGDRLRQENRAAWLERIPLLSAHIRLRDEFDKLDADIRHTQKFIHSQNFPTLAEDKKAYFHAQLVGLEAQRKELEKKIDDNLARLLGTKFWPVLPQSEAQDLEKRYKDSINTVEEQKDAASKMNNMLLQVIANQNRSPQNTLIYNEIEEPPSKRLRESEEEVKAYLEPNPTAQEFDALEEKMTAALGRLSDCEHALTQYSADSMEEMNARLEEKLDEANAARIAREEQQVEIQAASQAKNIAQIDQGFALIGDQVGQVAEEMATLIRESNAENTVSQQIRQEMVSLISERDHLASMKAEQAETLKELQSDIKAQKAALAAYIARPPTPPPSPPPLDIAAVIHLASPILSSSIRKTMLPHIEELRRSVEEMIDSKDSELRETLWDKLCLTLRTFEGIYAHVSRALSAVSQ